MFSPSHLLADGCLGAIASISCQLPTYVLQDAELQGSQRHLQVSPAHIMLRQPLQQRFSGGHVSRGPTPLRQLAAVDLSVNTIMDLRGNLMRRERELLSSVRLHNSKN